MQTVYVACLDWNVRGDAGHEIIGIFENYLDACEHIAEAVKSDMQNLGWFDLCDYTVAQDEKGNNVENTQPLPEKLSYFLIQEDEDFQGDYYEEYFFLEFNVTPDSTKK